MIQTKSGDILVRNHLVFPRSSCLIHAAVTVYSLYAPEKKKVLGKAIRALAFSLKHILRT